ncbi:lipin 1 [Rhodotorula toruloides]|uniref:phosphatidate phosphatase n=1 Tax=Rhodotorula toruloides TaxID=5286 RepID=A0A511K6S7_RHOTO|nr:lipin 1 [Rhodotorula toruloides]
MQWARKAVNYYSSINPATLTGAIDVIVVERPTESGDVELACSPFHVRFGKLSVLRPVDKKVRIHVNDRRVPFYMKVGETGEAFFVFETEADVPADMQTSPLSGPVSDDGRSDNGDGEIEALDLDAPATEQDTEEPREADEDQPLTPTPSNPSSPNSSRYVSLAGTQANSPTVPFRSFPSTPFLPTNSHSRSASIDHVTAQPLTDSPGDEVDDPHETARKKATHVPSPVARAAEKAAGIGAAAFNRPAQELRDASLRRQVKEEAGGKTGRRRSARDEYDLKGEPAEVGQPDDRLQAGLNGLSLNDHREGQKPTDTSEETGDAVIRAARHRNADVRALLGGKDGLGDAIDGTGDRRPSFSTKRFPTGELKIDSDQLLRDAQGHEYGGAPEDTGGLMLDVSGYKLESEKDEEKGKLKGAEQELRDVNRLDLDEKSEKEVMLFTQALLQSTDPSTLRSLFGEDDATSRASSPVPHLDLDKADGGGDSADRKIGPRPRASSPRPVSVSDLQSIHAESDIASSPDDGVYHATPKQFTLRTGGTVHVFELSLCGTDAFAQVNKTVADRLFAEHQITFNEFLEQDSIPDNPDLVVKYAGRYLTWDNASPVLASLAVYRKSLLAHPEHHRHADTTTDEQGKTHRRGWSLWWGRSRTTTAETASTASAPTGESSPPTSPPISPPGTPKSLPVSDAVDSKSLKLKKGMNNISFSVRSSYSGIATCTSRIFLWESDFQVVISDIDGTITKSDALGHVFTMIGRDWTHLGVAKLYTDISRNGYKMMYLTSRAIGQADTTREYLKGIKQNGFQLPDGPVIMSPDREVIMRKPEVFKMACLRDIQRLFGDRSPFYAGFGNRITDALSYRSVDIPSSRIFTIDSNGEVKMELLELAGYKSSYIHMTDLVDQMFPPINRTNAPEYTDFNFWRAPLPAFDIDIPELAPPSPALSARSDQSTSRISLSRLGNLASSLSRRSSRNALNDASSITSGGTNRNVRGATPTSPLLQATVPEEHGDDEAEVGYDESFLGNGSRSSSMPGSFDESDFDRYRAMAGDRTGAKSTTSEAEAYKKKVQGREDDAEEEEEEDEDVPEDLDAEVDDFGDQLDFSSVPLLLEQARQSVEEAADEEEGGLGSVKVVRETFVVPVGLKVGRRTGGDGGTGARAGVAPTKPQESADILKTVGKLKALRPLFTWAIHHPLRFLYHYMLVPIAKLLLLATTALLRLLLALILAAASPVRSLASLITTPLIIAWSAFAALAPLWWALGGALTFGAGLGFVAGLVAGRTTREIIDDTVDRTTGTLRWLGVLEKKREAGLGGFGQGARLEKVPSGPARRMSDKARGKQRSNSNESVSRSSSEAFDIPHASIISTSPRLNPLLQRFKREATAYSSARNEGLAYVDY